MTLWYLIGAVAVLGIAFMSMIGVGGGAASGPLLWAGRILPGIGALIACIAYCIAAARARLGVLAPVFFCLALAALVAVQLLPHLMPVRKSNFYLILLTIYPVLTLFPAMALWHLASALKKRAR